jgi:hypothetical protein
MDLFYGLAGLRVYGVAGAIYISKGRGAIRFGVCVYGSRTGDLVRGLDGVAVSG